LFCFDNFDTFLRIFFKILTLFICFFQKHVVNLHQLINQKINVNRPNEKIIEFELPEFTGSEKQINKKTGDHEPVTITPYLVVRKGKFKAMRTYIKETKEFKQLPNAIFRNGMDYTQDFLGNNGVDVVRINGEMFYAFDTIDDFKWWKEIIELENESEYMYAQLSKLVDADEFEKRYNEIINEIGWVDLEDAVKLRNKLLAEWYDEL